MDVLKGLGNEMMVGLKQECAVCPVIAGVSLCVNPEKLLGPMFDDAGCDFTQ